MRNQIFSLSRSIVANWLAIAVLACGLANAQSPWRLKFSPGEKLQYAFEQQSQTESSGAGKPVSVTIKMALRVTWNVESVDDQGVATIRQAIHRLSVKMQTNNRDVVTYDSESKTGSTPTEKEIAEAVEPLLKASYVLRINPRGEVTIQSTEPPLEKLTSDNLLTASDVLRPVRDARIVLPEKPVATGDSWEVVDDISAAQGKVTEKYTSLGAAERNGKMLEKIDLELQFTSHQPQSPEKKSPEKKSTDTNSANKNSAEKKSAEKATSTVTESEGNGTLWFDAMAGRLVAAERKVRLVTERPYRDMIIRTQSTMTSTTTLVENSE